MFASANACRTSASTPSADLFQFATGVTEKADAVANMFTFIFGANLHSKYILPSPLFKTTCGIMILFSFYPLPNSLGGSKSTAPASFVTGSTAVCSGPASLSAKCQDFGDTLYRSLVLSLGHYRSEVFGSPFYSLRVLSFSRL